MLPFTLVKIMVVCLEQKYSEVSIIYGVPLELHCYDAPLVREVAAAVDLRICFCIDQPHLKSFDHVNCV